MRAALRPWLGLALAAGLGACSNLRVELGEPVDLDLCRTFTPGATRAEVLAALGPPTAIGSHEGGAALAYEYLLLDEAQLGINLQNMGVMVGVPELSWLKLSLGDGGSERQAAVFLFDAEGRLLTTSTSDWDENLGTGAGLQIFLALQDVIDRGTLEDLPEAFLWGERLLHTPPEMLNLPMRPDLELRGYPSHAGQRTMELPEAR